MNTETKHWTCPNCSSLIESQLENCWKCGSDKEGNVVAAPVKPDYSASSPLSPSPASCVGWSVLAFALFWPLGLMALVYSVLAEVADIHGKTGKSVEYCWKASRWRFRAYIAFVVFVLVAGVIQFSW